jgi:hypothetical protein
VGGAEASWDETVERLPDGFLGGTLKEFFGSAIEQEDGLLTINSDDGIHCRIDDPGQSRLTLTRCLSADVTRVCIVFDFFLSI